MARVTGAPQRPRGRPPAERELRLQVRLSAPEHRELERSARLAGVDVGTYMRDRALEAARGGDAEAGRVASVIAYAASVGLTPERLRAALQDADAPP